MFHWRQRERKLDVFFPQKKPKMFAGVQKTEVGIVAFFVFGGGGGVFEPTEVIWVLAVPLLYGLLSNQLMLSGF